MTAPPGSSFDNPATAYALLRRADATAPPCPPLITSRRRPWYPFPFPQRPFRPLPAHTDLPMLVPASAHAKAHSSGLGEPTHEHLHVPHGQEQAQGRTRGSEAEDQAKERAHFQSVLKAFDSYLPYGLAANNARRRSLYSLPQAHQALLNSLGPALPGPILDSYTPTSSTPSSSTEQAIPRGFKARLDEIDDRIRRNADVLSQIVADSRGFLGEEPGGPVPATADQIEVEVEAEAEAGPSGPRGDVHIPENVDPANPLPKPIPMMTMSGGDPSSLSDGAENATGLAIASGSASTSSSVSPAPLSPPGTAEEEEDGLRPSGLSASSNTNASAETGKSGTMSSRRTKRRTRKVVSEVDLDKIRSTIKQFVRDWSEEGKAERDAAYNPILDALDSRFGHVPVESRPEVRVLVPGAGLGRLAFEIAWAGYSCQGNEFSFYMLLASHFVLNKTTHLGQHVIYPHIHSASNWRSAKDMLRPVAFPDVLPSELPDKVDFSMVAGEFVEVYSNPSEQASWDAVATCFFLDTARNVVRYLEVLNFVLPLGGIWINVGPLLWHYENNSRGETSVELTLEEVCDLVGKMGFQIERTLSPQTYTGNPRGMLRYDYTPEFWIARKVRQVTAAPSV